MSTSARNSRLPPRVPYRTTNGGTMKGCSCIALLCILSGCAVGPNFHRPPAPPATHYSNGTDPATTASVEGTAQQFNPGAAVAADWWRLFHSPQLDAVIREAIANNPGLDAAQASLRASQNNLRSGYGIFYPSIDAAAGATRERYSATNIGENVPSTVFNLFTLSATVSYALDVFGGQRRLVEGLHAEVDVAHANERATYLALAANIVNTVVAEAAYRAEIEATAQLIELQKEQVGIAKVQADAGTVPYSNVLSLQSQLASYEATIPQLQQKLVQSDDLLAALAGHAPAEWKPPPVSLEDLTLPSQLPVSLPSDLVRQRPDILAAEATAHAASANIGVATAALLPSVTLNGGIAAATNSTSNLFPPMDALGAWERTLLHRCSKGEPCGSSAKRRSTATTRQWLFTGRRFWRRSNKSPTPCVDSITMPRCCWQRMKRFRAPPKRCIWFKSIMKRVSKRIWTSCWRIRSISRRRSPICRRLPYAIRTPSRYLPRSAAAGGTYSGRTLAPTRRKANDWPHKAMRF